MPLNLLLRSLLKELWPCLGLAFMRKAPQTQCGRSWAKFDPQARKNPSLFSQEPPSRSRPEKKIEADEEDEEDNDDQACGSFFGSNLWSML